MRGEFNIGCLFNIGCRNYIFKNWDFCNVPILLEQGMMDLFSLQTMLHTAIYFGAPHNVLVDIINRFDGCSAQKDSMGRYPIDVAIEEAKKQIKKNEAERDEEVVNETALRDPENVFYTSQNPNSLKWNEGMQDILTALAAAQGRLIINVAVEYGLPSCDKGIKDVIC